MSSAPLLQDWLGDDAAKRHRREVHFPTGRFGEAIEQAQAVLFLASDESSFVNGTDFVVDGGMTKVHKFASILASIIILLINDARHTLHQKDRPHSLQLILPDEHPEGYTYARFLKMPSICPRCLIL